MHPRSIWAIARKDFLDIWLNKATLVGLLFPIILSLLWLLIGNLIGGQKINLLMYNPGNSSLAQAVEQSFPGAEIVQASSIAQVRAAFGPDGAKAKSAYAVGLVLPEDFDTNLKSGKTPALVLYLNGTIVNTQTQALLKIAIINFARAIANPQPPVAIETTVFNPPSTENAGVIIKQVYLPLALLVSLMIGITFTPQLLLEEKEKKTLRMLLITPASFSDILIGKLLVVLVFQLTMTLVVLAIMGGFAGMVLLVMLYVFLGACLSLSLGLLFGSLFNSVQSASTISGLVSIVFIASGIFAGQLGELLGRGPVFTLVRLIPTYYLAEGVVNASQNLGSFGSNLLDIGIILGSSVVFLAISAWALRRQSATLAMI